MASTLKHTTIVCLCCGKEKEIRADAAARGQRFCSIKCSRQYNRVLVKRVCPQCGKEEWLSPSIAKRQTFCSRKCHALSRYEKRVCEYCEKEFMQLGSVSVKSRFCSQECWGKSKRVDPEESKTLMNRRERKRKESKDWRKDVFRRDDYTCQECGIRNQKGLGVTVRLEAHHIKSWKEYPELRYDINNGITLCKSCHRELHGLNKKAA
jgi:5-methylcytosine-specific restriction endonuclease McrA